MSIVFDIRTIQSGAFKTLCESLKDLLTETQIKISEKGIKIVTTNNEDVVLIHLTLDSEKFEAYVCNRPISIGINMLNFYKIIKTINNQETLTLYMYDNDMNHLGVKIENEDKNTQDVYKVDLLDIDPREFEIPQVSFNTVVTIPSSDLHKIIRDMNTIADYVEIKCIDNKFILSCRGDFCSREIIIRDNDSVEIRSESKEDIIQGNFSLKYLNIFTKCTGMSPNTELYMKNDYALIVLYKVASLGEIKLCLTPQISRSFN
jgi:proliferating cell nuclear antigen